MLEISLAVAAQRREQLIRRCVISNSESEKRMCHLLKITILSCVYCIKKIIRENINKDNIVSIKAYLQAQEESGSGKDLRSLFPTAEFWFHPQTLLKEFCSYAEIVMVKLRDTRRNQCLPLVVGNKLCGKCQFQNSFFLHDSMWVRQNHCCWL